MGIINRKTRKNIYYLFSRIRERLMGLDFSTFLEPDDLGLSPKKSFPYERSNEKMLKFVFDDLPINNNDSLLDIGCGKGYAISILKKYPFNKVDGVEISSTLANIARNNLRKLKIESTIYESDAINFSGLDSYNYLYISNPFPESEMCKFAQTIKRSLINNPRDITIVYYNPLFYKYFKELSYKSQLYEQYVDNMKIGVVVYYINNCVLD